MRLTHEVMETDGTATATAVPRSAAMNWARVRVMVGRSFSEGPLAPTPPRGRCEPGVGATGRMAPVRDALACAAALLVPAAWLPRDEPGLPMGLAGKAGFVPWGTTGLPASPGRFSLCWSSLVGIRVPFTPPAIAGSCHIAGIPTPNHTALHPESPFLHVCEDGFRRSWKLSRMG